MQLAIQYNYCLPSRLVEWRVCRNHNIKGETIIHQDFLENLYPRRMHSYISQYELYTVAKERPELLALAPPWCLAPGPVCRQGL